MQMIAENDRGWVALDGNELIVGSKVFDPPKVRVTCPVNADGGGGGVFSFNVSRRDGVVQDGHEQDEIAMIRVEQSEDVRGQMGNHKAELNLMLADGSGIGDVVKPLAFVWNAVTRILPEFAGALRQALGGGVGTAAVPAVLSGFPNKLVSPDGLVELDIQNADALNMTYYERATPDGPGVALWSLRDYLVNPAGGGFTPAGKARFLR